MKLGENCDVDVLLVHAPGAEKEFFEKGFGQERRQVMYNDFVVIGPESDPAGIKDKRISEALGAIKNAFAPFLSRGDDSGTDKMEKQLWKKAGLGLPETENWYIQTGQGMLATITVAQEKSGYSITDRGTYIKYQDQKGSNAPLKVLVEGDEVLLNQYSVVTLNPTHCLKARHDLAKIFSDWMGSATGQQLIRDFRLLGQQLFVPNAQ